MTPEEKKKLMDVLKREALRGLGYVRIWRMLRKDGVNVSRRTVEYWYRKFFPERLGRRGKYLPRELRITLYEEVLRLRRQGLGYKKIRRRIKELYDITLAPAVIVDWCRGIHTPYGGIRIPTVDYLKPSPELAYVIGVVCGDGSAVKTRGRSGEYVIGSQVKDREFSERFAECLGRILNRSPPTPILVRGKFQVCVRSRTLYQLLRKPIDINRIKNFTEHCEDCMRSFLKGFFDSEGSVSKEGEIRCDNSDKQLLNYVKTLLNRLCIDVTGPHLGVKKDTPIFNKDMQRIYMRKKEVYYLNIRAPYRLKYYELVGFSIRKKQQRMENYFRRRGLLGGRLPDHPL